MTITEQVNHTIHHELLAAQETNLKIIENTQHADIHNTDDDYAELEGHIERISSILADRRTNHTH